MNTLIQKFSGQTRYWWAILIAGLLMVFCGFAYWFWPVAGYAVASQIFGWILILIGVVQLLVSSGPNRSRGWGWWLAGGIIDIFIGFLLVRSIVLSEAVFPYFIAFIFLYWGISAICDAIAYNRLRYRWVRLINGILLMFFGFFFIEAGWVQDVIMTGFLTSLAFVYWGMSLAILSYDMRPAARS